MYSVRGHQRKHKEDPTIRVRIQENIKEVGQLGLEFRKTWKFWTIKIALKKHEKVGQSKHHTNIDRKRLNIQGVTLRKHKRGRIVEA